MGIRKRKSPNQDEVLQEAEPALRSSFFTPREISKLTVAQVKEKSNKKPLCVHEALPQPPFLLTIVAPRKSGKTNLLLDSLIEKEKYCGQFDIIIVWSRTFHHDTKWKNIELPPGSVFTSFDENDVNTLMKVAEHVAKKVQVNSLFIFDDMITDGIMNARRMGTLESIAVRGRHANISIAIITQQYLALSPPVRNNSTNSIFFRVRNGDELEKIMRENRESLTPDQFFELYNYATEEPFSFLHVNNQQTDPKKRFVKQWDTLLQLK